MLRDTHLTDMIPPYCSRHSFQKSPLVISESILRLTRALQCMEWTIAELIELEEKNRVEREKWRSSMEMNSPGNFATAECKRCKQIDRSVQPFLDTNKYTIDINIDIIQMDIDIIQYKYNYVRDIVTTDCLTLITIL